MQPSPPHRIPSAVVEQVRSHDWPTGRVDLVPTHGDLSPRNWVVHHGVVSFIDLGRADLRPAASDLFRLQDRSWRGRPDLEVAFFEGYGADPREVWWWRSFVLAELVATAAWAHRVGDEAFEAEGLRGLDEFFAPPPEPMPLAGRADREDDAPRARRAGRCEERGPSWPGSCSG